MSRRLGKTGCSCFFQTRGKPQLPSVPTTLQPSLSLHNPTETWLPLNICRAFGEGFSFLSDRDHEQAECVTGRGRRARAAPACTRIYIYIHTCSKVLAQCWALASAAWCIKNICSNRQCCVPTTSADPQVVQHPKLREQMSQRSTTASQVNVVTKPGSTKPGSASDRHAAVESNMFEYSRSLPVHR